MRQPDEQARRPKFSRASSQEIEQGYLSHFTSPLLKLAPDVEITLDQAFTGFQVFGGSGAGKSSGTGTYLARTLLKAGFGGLVLCAKPEEASVWLEHARATARMDAVYRFASDEPYRFNFLAHELARGSSPFEVADVLENAIQAHDPARSMAGSKDGDFWEAAGRDLLVNALQILFGSTGTVELEELSRLITTAPTSRKEALDPNFQDRSTFFKHWKKIYRSGEGAYLPGSEIAPANDYFQNQYSKLAENTRTSIVQTLMTSLNRFRYGSLRDLFTNDTNIAPEMTHGGAIIIVDLPAMDGKDNKIAGQIWKYAFQRVSQRATNASTRPVFLWADEAQYFLSRNDVKFQSTARSSKVSTVYLTQSIPAYVDELGGSETARTAVHAFIGNLRTTIYHSNQNPETNNHAAEHIGKTLVKRRNWSRGKTQGETRSTGTSMSFGRTQTRGNNSSVSRGSSGTQDTASWSYGSSYSDGSSVNEGMNEGHSRQEGQSINEGMSEQRDYLLPPEVFAHQLREGNARHGFLVDAIVVSSQFDEPYHKITFRQFAPLDESQ